MAKLSDKEIERRKALREKCGTLFDMSAQFCTGRPPQKVIGGSAQDAIEFKDLISEFRKLSPSVPSRVDFVEGRIQKLSRILSGLQKFS
jgi:hypothetical protein